MAKDRQTDIGKVIDVERYRDRGAKDRHTDRET